MPETSGITGIGSRTRAIEVGNEKPAGVLSSESSIAEYTYKGLSDPSTGIRLLKLLPGVSNDVIVVQIEHARLTDPGSPTKPHISQKSVADNIKSLPTGWAAHRNWSEHVIYFNRGLGLSTWQHPSGKDFTNLQETIFRPAPDESAEIPHYEALSYTWGSTDNRKVIYIQDSDGKKKKMVVTENLALALCHLRSPMAKRTLWIDAICINQENLKERNIQVQRMTSIYRLAHRVLVWLGPASASSSLALSTLKYLGEQVEICQGGLVIPTPRAVEQHWYRYDFDLPYDEMTWTAIMRLCQRPYFSRVWIMQELHLSNHRTTIQCGSESVSWVTLCKAMNCFRTRRNIPSLLFRLATSAVGHLANREARGLYSNLTLAVRNRNCSNDRDRVYGLLGLMPEGLRERITPDYEATVGEVYRQETVAQIAFFQRVDVLSECGFHRATDGPSWVPNLASRHLSMFQIRSVSGISRCYVAFDNPNIAEISGLQVGTIISVQEKGHWEFGQGIEHTRSWAYEDLDRDVYSLTLCGMFVRERWFKNMVHYRDPLPSLEEWKRFYYGDTKESSDTDQEIAPVFLEYVERCIWLRTLFIMGDGKIGLGPEKMIPGDVVCVFLGCDSPIIIRQQSDGTYRVVGEAFVYALRDAYALLGPLPEPWLVQQKDAGIRPDYWFLNQETGEMTRDDPRLGPLIGWERLDVDMGVDDPRTCQKYKNIETGQIINYDPRMSLDALKARGVELKTFALS